MRVNAFLTFFSHFFEAFLAVYFETRFLYYIYLEIFGNIFYKKIAYMCVYARVLY